MPKPLNTDYFRSMLFGVEDALVSTTGMKVLAVGGIATLAGLVVGLALKWYGL